MTPLTVVFSLLALPVFGDDLFQLAWRGTVYSTGSNGQIQVRHFSEQDFVNKAAQDNGIDPKLLVFVYRPTKHDTAVVWKANGGFVADVIQMEYDFTEVSNSSQTLTIRQAFLVVEGPNESNITIGSAFGKETTKYDTSGSILADNFRGQFQYAKDGAVYSGNFSTSKRISDTSGN